MMPCGPDIWQSAKSGVPLLAFCGGLSVYVAIVVFLLWAPRVRNRSARIVCRVAGGILALPLTLAAPVVGFGALLISGSPPAQTRTVASPLRQEATLKYQAGFLGRDHTEVILKSRNDCGHTRVLSHAGPSSFDDLQIEWLDNEHLQLTYHTRPDDLQRCEKQVDDVSIKCVATPWPSSTGETVIAPTTTDKLPQPTPPARDPAN